MIRGKDFLAVSQENQSETDFGYWQEFSRHNGNVFERFALGPSLSTIVRYRFVVTQPVPISVDIAVSGDKVRLEDAGDGNADVTFRCDTETFLLLTNGRLAPVPAIAVDRLEVEGDNGVAADFGQWFKGI